MSWEISKRKSDSFNYKNIAHFRTPGNQFYCVDFRSSGVYILQICISFLSFGNPTVISQVHLLHRLCVLCRCRCVLFLALSQWSARLSNRAGSRNGNCAGHRSSSQEGYTCAFRGSDMSSLVLAASFLRTEWGFSSQRRYRMVMGALW